jgi:hypothetical protein
MGHCSTSNIAPPVIARVFRRRIPLDRYHVTQASETIYPSFRDERAQVRGILIDEFFGTGDAG